ncbi:MAG: bifunctional salicylyl-CoA 5-hydroxylase/oxidoreductase [Planctomycetes bacterium]|nr:bifunctional salicylyl-CoA 5-hydroxylase/oxidoreductase [Planctomycetota bacterium]
MRIACIGGGPAGLFFAILMKKSFPAAAIDVYERNRAGDTFGWGVVFSDETLDNLDSADGPSLQRIRESFRYWSDIDTWIQTPEARVRSTGHGFCGMSRVELLRILTERACELGVRVQFETEVQLADLRASHDLVVACDGVNSRVRDELAEHFRPSIDWRQCRFAWFGTDKDLEAFTFVFKRTEHGLFQVHAYPYRPGLGTWIVECQDDTWRRAGLDRLDEEQSARFCEGVFADWLDGHRLLVNRSIWRRFPTIRCESWHHDNVVLIGDAAHTAHFSIGSGTKLAMEDAIVLRDAFVSLGRATFGPDDVRAALRAYQEARHVDVAKTQKAAQTSLEWFENSDRYMAQDPETFTFNLMTRSKRITYDNLAMRDPTLVARANRAYWRTHAPDAAAASGGGEPPPPMFAPLRVGDLELPNRVMVSPMCQYSAVDGVVDDWHLVHLGSRAIGGAGLVVTEMTNVSPDGRITPGCAGLWNEVQARAWRRIVDFVHGNTPAKIGVQLAHAGRKGSTQHAWDGTDTPLDAGAWETLAPSAIPFRPDWPAPRAMDRADMDRVRDDFAHAARLAHDAGFDLVELHMAHGYLLSSFLSPLSNRRDDDYGGSLANRLRFPLEVLDAVRAAWPADRPIAVRITACDWAGDEGLGADDAVAIARALGEHGADLIDVSTGGNVHDRIPEYGRMYQVPFAERIRAETGLLVAAVGAIQGADHCNTVLAAERADLCALARPHLADPYLTARAAGRYGYAGQWWPGQYAPGRPRD